ncbi:MAG: hypothetical protein ACYC1E_12775 [Propionibacteriaceae bacterium]
MPALRRAAVLVSALLLLWVLGVPAAVADASGFTVTDDRVTSLVGLATDHDHSLYWTANSTPDTKTSVMTLDPGGRVRAVLTYPQSTTGVLAIGYEANTVYVLDKSPKANVLRLSYITLPGLVVSGSLPYHFYELVLPETGQTIAALVVAPQKQFAVVSAQGRVYKAPAKPSLAGTNRLTKVSSGVTSVTGGYYDTVQKAVVLRTPDGIVTADPTTFATRATLPVAGAADGRGIAPALDKQSYLLGQGSGTTVLAVSLSGASPSASGTNPSSASSSPSSSPTDAVAGTPAATGPTSQLYGNATRLALGGALVLALLAGLIVVARR